MRKSSMVLVVLIAGVFLLSGCARMTGQTAGQHVDDATITGEANAAILQDPDSKFFKINVNTTNGDVVLQGFINSRATEDRLMSKIKQIRGVKSVKSLLRVEKG